MTADDILKELVRIRPDFQSYWDGVNYHRDDDGFFTTCGVFSQFTDFFSAQHLKMKKEELAKVAALVGRCEVDDILRDAAYTCFLENIAGDPPDKTLEPYLSPKAVGFMSNWRPRQ